MLCHLGTQKGVCLCLKCTKIRLALGELKRFPRPLSHSRGGPTSKEVRERQGSGVERGQGGKGGRKGKGKKGREEGREGREGRE